MPIFTRPTHEANDCHEPAGSEKGGQFCSRKSLKQRLADRAAGMRRNHLARGGVEAEKQRKREHQMARGRATQQTVRAIRQREEEAEDIPAGQQGECFRNAASFSRLHEEFLVVHGKVTNGAGRTFDHAWNETPSTVVDPTTGVKMDKDRWYRLVQAEPEARYTAEQVAILMLRTHNLGPWTDAEVGPRSVWRKS